MSKLLRSESALVGAMTLEC